MMPVCCSRRENTGLHCHLVATHAHVVWHVSLDSDSVWWKNSDHWTSQKKKIIRLGRLDAKKQHVRCQLTVTLRAVWSKSMICGSPDFVSETWGMICGEKGQSCLAAAILIIHLSFNKIPDNRHLQPWFNWPESLWAADGEGGALWGGCRSHEVEGQGWPGGCAAAEHWGRASCQSLSSTSAPVFTRQNVTVNTEKLKLFLIDSKFLLSPVALSPNDRDGVQKWTENMRAVIEFRGHNGTNLSVSSSRGKEISTPGKGNCEYRTLKHRTEHELNPTSIRSVPKMFLCRVSSVKIKTTVTLWPWRVYIRRPSSRSSIFTVLSLEPVTMKLLDGWKEKLLTAALWTVSDGTHKAQILSSRVYDLKAV